jgi:hypothetical protein
LQLEKKSLRAETQELKKVTPYFPAQSSPNVFYPGVASFDLPLPGKLNKRSRPEVNKI